jgi:hypothetical protein
MQFPIRPLLTPVVKYVYGRNSLIRKAASIARLRHHIYATAVLSEQAVARQLFSRYHVVTPKDKNATREHDVFYVVRAWAI